MEREIVTKRIFITNKEDSMTFRSGMIVAVEEKPFRITDFGTIIHLNTDRGTILTVQGYFID